MLNRAWLRAVVVIALIIVVVIATLILLGPQINSCASCNAPGNHPAVPPSATGS